MRSKGNPDRLSDGKLLSDFSSGTDGEIGYRLSLTLLVIALYAGSADLSRIVSGAPSVELRSLIGVPALMASSITVLSSKRHPRRSGGSQIFMGSLTGWFIFVAASAYWAPSSEYMSTYILDVLWLGAFALAGYAIARRATVRELRYLALLIFALGMLFAGEALATNAVGHGRFSAFGGGPNVFVRVVVLACIFGVMLFFEERRLIFLATAPLLLTTAILSGSRGGLVALFGAVLLFLIVQLRSAKKLFRALMCLGAVALIVIGVVWRVPGAAQWVESRFGDTLLGEEVYTSGRDVLFQAAVELFQANPLFGAGLTAFPNRYGGGYPHNIFLESLASTGILGTLLLCGAVVSGLSVALRQSRQNRHATALLIAVVFLILAAQFSGGLYDSRLIWFLMPFVLVDDSRSTSLHATAGHPPELASGRKRQSVSA